MATGQIGKGLVGVGDLGIGALQIGVVLAHVVLDVDHLLLGIGAQLFQAAFQSRDGHVPFIRAVIVVAAGLVIGQAVRIHVVHHFLGHQGTVLGVLFRRPVGVGLGLRACGDTGVGIGLGLAASLDYDNLNDELSALRRALYFDLGVPFPGINLRVSSSLSGLTYELQVNEIPMSRGHLEQGMVLARESGDTLRMLGLDVRRGENFLPDVESLWIPAEKQALLEQAGLSCMTHSRILAYHLSLILARHASSFIGMQETKYLLDRMEERAPDLVREATRLLPVQRIAEIFQRLAQEQVSIRDLRNILEAIIEWSPKEKDTVMLTEYVRGALKRQISYMYSRGQNMLPAILMDPSVEETIRKAIRQTSAGAFLALDPDTSRRFIAAVGAAAGDYRKHVQMPVLLASMDIRRYVRRLIEGEHYRLPVVSYQELTPEISVQPMNRIRL